MFIMRTNKAEVVIRKYKEGDLDPVIELYREIFAEEPWNEKWSYEAAKSEIKDFLKQENIVFLIAQCDNEIIGFRIAFDMKPENFPFLKGLVKDKEAMYGKELAVKKDYRNLGIGTNMVLQSFEIARELGYKKFLGRTYLKSKMVPVYSRLGYINTGITDPNYPDRVYFIRYI